jgi:hypothetical protein
MEGRRLVAEVRPEPHSKPLWVMDALAAAACRACVCTGGSGHERCRQGARRQLWPARDRRGQPETGPDLVAAEGASVLMPSHDGRLCATLVRE